MPDMENIDGREQCRGSEVEVSPWTVGSSAGSSASSPPSSPSWTRHTQVSKYNCYDHLNYVFITFSNIFKTAQFWCRIVT